MLRKISPLAMLGIVMCLGMLAVVGRSMFMGAQYAKRQEQRAVFFTLRPAENQQEHPAQYGDITIAPAQEE